MQLESNEIVAILPRVFEFISCIDTLITIAQCNKFLLTVVRNYVQKEMVSYYEKCQRLLVMDSEVSRQVTTWKMHTISRYSLDRTPKGFPTFFDMKCSPSAARFLFQWNIDKRKFKIPLQMDPIKLEYLNRFHIPICFRVHSRIMKRKETFLFDGTRIIVYCNFLPLLRMPQGVPTQVDFLVTMACNLEQNEELYATILEEKTSGMLWIVGSNTSLELHQFNDVLTGDMETKAKTFFKRWCSYHIPKTSKLASSYQFVQKIKFLIGISHWNSTNSFIVNSTLHTFGFLWICVVLQSTMIEFGLQGLQSLTLCLAAPTNRLEVPSFLQYCCKTQLFHGLTNLNTIKVDVGPYYDPTESSGKCT